MYTDQWCILDSKQVEAGGILSHCPNAQQSIMQLSVVIICIICLTPNETKRCLVKTVKIEENEKT